MGAPARAHEPPGHGRDQAGGDGRVQDRSQPDAVRWRLSRPHERFLHSPDGFYGHRPRAPATPGAPGSDRRNRARELKAQLLMVPEAERLASEGQFMSPENQALHASRQQRPMRKNIRKTSSTISSSPG